MRCQPILGNNKCLWHCNVLGNRLQKEKLYTWKLLFIALEIVSSSKFLNTRIYLRKIRSKWILPRIIFDVSYWIKIGNRFIYLIGIPNSKGECIHLVWSWVCLHLKHWYYEKIKKAQKRLSVQKSFTLIENHGVQRRPYRNQLR